MSRASISWPRGLARRALRLAGRHDEPLDWATPGTARAARPPEGGVCVVLPVHGAHEAFLRCLESVARHTDLTRHSLLVVIDGDPELVDRVVLEPFGEGRRVSILRQDEQRGFVVSVNRGMAACDGDIVLLNSDTLVTAGWLERMEEAAYSSPDVATVTPFSNHATLCSLPRPWRANALPEGLDVETFGARVEEASARRYPRLPCGVGMCLYVKRQALEEIGPFDERRFGTGYGEETDFCLRALGAGYRHVLDDATFIFHEGHGSFGAARRARLRDAERQLRRRHPRYLATIADFMARDPLAAARERVLAVLPEPAAALAGPRRVLHVVHGWPPESQGGTELYAHWLATAQSQQREVAVYAREADSERALGSAREEHVGGLRVRRVVNNFKQRNPLSRNALRDRRLERDFADFAARFEPDLVHVHHLAGHSMGLMRRAAALGVPVLYQVQDWWLLCARANLLPPDRRLCSGPGAAKCSACLPLTGLPPGGLWNRLLYGLRRRLAARVLAAADATLMGSRAIAESYREEGLLSDATDRLHVLPYGVPAPPRPPRRSDPVRPLCFGYVGTLMPHKGVHVAVEAFRGLAPGAARLELWGNPEGAPDYTRELRDLATDGAVTFEGRFSDAQKPEIFARFDVLLVPSLGLESYGLVAREAMGYGVPVIASRRGALRELFDGIDGEPPGAFFKAGDSEALATWVRFLVERPEQILEWRRRLPQVVSCEEHAAAVERIYRGLMARHPAVGEGEE